MAAGGDPASPLGVTLSGTGAAAPVGGRGIAGVPTLSEWGLLMLSLLLGGVALCTIRARQT